MTNAAGNIEAHLSYTPSYPNRDCRRIERSSSIRMIQNRNMDGGLFCEVVRVNQTRYQSIDWFLDKKPFFLQLASGKVLKGKLVWLLYGPARLKCLPLHGKNYV